ncbi:TPA: hypothetical protein WI703_000476, partial [Neisseria meningitidis]
WWEFRGFWGILQRSQVFISASAAGGSITGVCFGKPFFMQWVIDHAIVSADRDLLLTLALGFGLLMIVQQLVSLLQTWAGMYLSTSLNIQWKANVLRRLMDLLVQFLCWTVFLPLGR